ncbi:MAG: lactate utilization protein [Firmicutes bacterium]|nr:lactate utilization protein [Bacillota bacterium]
MNDVKKKRYGILGPKVAEALEKRNFEAYYFDSIKEARTKILDMIAPDASVGYGGSLTVNALQLKEALRERGNALCDRDLATNPDERKAIEHAALNADWFLMSANAISEDGQLVNIDGFGNRVAALIYGPENVLVVAGMNKVVKTLDDAYSRARGTAAPENMARFTGLNTPCATTGSCADCLSPDCICNQLVHTRRCNPPKRIKVVLIGDDLGL